MNPAVERDAFEFGIHEKMRGWRMGLLVARCVEPRQGARRSTSPDSGKVTQAGFERASGINRETIALYLKAWDKAESAGVVPPRSELEPGVDPELNWDALPPWEEYYEARRGGWRSQKGGDDEWYTRPEFVEAARTVLGGIDLDPASCEKAQRVVQATRYYSKSERNEDGLKLPWEGRVFLNPPFSVGGAFGERLRQFYEAGSVEAAIMVISAYSADTRWFEPFFRFPFCVSSRPAFYKDDPAEKNSPSVWPAFVYLGDEHDDFVAAFDGLGHVVRKTAPPDTTLMSDDAAMQMEIMTALVDMANAGEISVRVREDGELVYWSPDAPGYEPPK